MRIILFAILLSGVLMGCGHEADTNMKDKIQFVPNEDYVGDPSPTVKEEMKLTPEEHAEFEKLQKKIQEEKEAE
ncbi:hypothetical protein D1B31_02515 [Neobacillus notoginsengisoli]|uniref:Lipoprotein n=1 Tax=Neobacillus notoginsengisoli TaxID=1578198 RepID=A0A417Z0R1_9BACI|nr:hypothetical protein [Neobacillus notoginsengisoli]RHW43544.1 hypothetical protein D1B31_02515 [Neobacillus notoginsengisoli]